MTTLLTPPRTSTSPSHFTNYTPPHYPAMESVRAYCPNTLSSSERREHGHLNPPGVVSPVTPKQRNIRTPPALVSTPSTVSSATRGDPATFHILASSQSPPTPRPIKGPWTPSEDRLLLSLVNELGAEKWVVIASRLGTRTGKQCRERWHNHVNPILNKAPFSLEEEEAIERYYAEIGPKWAEIAKKLPGRSMFPNSWHN